MTLTATPRPTLEVQATVFALTHYTPPPYLPLSRPRSARRGPPLPQVRGRIAYRPRHWTHTPEETRQRGGPPLPVSPAPASPGGFRNGVAATIARGGRVTVAARTTLP
jgi:hypothetical protein